MNYWQKLSIKLKEAYFLDEYIEIVLYLFNDRPIEELIDSSPATVTEAINEYIMSKGLDFVAMPDDVEDMLRIAQEVYQEMQLSSLPLQKDRSQSQNFPDKTSSVDQTKEKKKYSEREVEKMKYTEDLKKRLIEEGFDAHFVKHIIDDFEDIPIQEFAHYSKKELGNVVDRVIHEAGKGSEKLSKLGLEEKKKIVKSLQLHQVENIRVLDETEKEIKKINSIKNDDIEPTDTLKVPSANTLGLKSKDWEAVCQTGVKTLNALAKINVGELSHASGVSAADLAKAKAIAAYATEVGMDLESARALVEIGKVRSVSAFASKSSDEIMEILKKADNTDYKIPNMVLKDDIIIRGWVDTATQNICGPTTGFSDWEYLQYLIEFSKDSAEQLENRFHQKFTITADEAAKEKEEKLLLSVICIDALKSMMNIDWPTESDLPTRSAKEWVEELIRKKYHLPTDSTKEEIQEAARDLWGKYYIDFLFDHDYSTTRVEQCIRTLQSYFNDHPDLHLYEFEAEDESIVHREIGREVEIDNASDGKTILNERDDGKGFACYGPYLDLWEHYKEQVTDTTEWPDNATVKLTVVFRLKTNDNWSGSKLCRISIDKWKRSSRSTERQIYSDLYCSEDDFPTTQEYSLFTLEKIIGDIKKDEPFEFRIKTFGDASLWIDYIECHYTSHQYFICDEPPAEDDILGQLFNEDDDGICEVPGPLDPFDKKYNLAGAQKIRHSIGQPVEDQDTSDKSAWLVGRGDGGLVVAGPTLWHKPSFRPPISRALAKFTIAVNDVSMPNAQVAELDIYNTETGLVIADKEILRRDLPTAYKRKSRLHFYSVPLEFLSEGAKYELRVHSKGFHDLWVDKIWVRFNFLYRHEWEMIMEKRYFPENFYRIRESIVSGNMDELLLNIQNIYLPYTQQEDDPLSEEAYILLQNTMEIEKTLSSAHTMFYTEEYGAALQEYLKVEKAIRDFFLKYAWHLEKDSGILWETVFRYMNPRQINDLSLISEETEREIRRLIQFLNQTLFPHGGNNSKPVECVAQSITEKHLSSRKLPRNLQYLENNLNIDLRHYDIFMENAELDTDEDQIHKPNRDTLRALINSMGFGFLHYYYLVLPVSMGDCHSASGRWSTADKYYRLVLSPDNEPVYPFLNSNIETEFVKIRIGRNLLAWADALFRQNTQESKDQALRKYDILISKLYETPNHCGVNVYNIKQDILDTAGRSMSRTMIESALANIEKIRKHAESRQSYTEALQDYKENSRKLLKQSGEKGNPIELVKWNIHTHDVLGSVSEAKVSAARLSSLDGGMSTEAVRESSSTVHTYKSKSPWPLGRGPLQTQGPRYFCMRENPEILRQKETACLRIDMIRKGMNILGYKDDFLSIYRYDYLLSLAQNLANQAQSLEKDFVQYKTRFEDENITQLTAEMMMKSEKMMLHIEEARLSVASNQILQADLSHKKLIDQKEHQEWKLVRTGDFLDYLAVVVGGGSSAVGATAEAVGTAVATANPVALLAAAPGLAVSGVSIAKGIKDIETAKADIAQNIQDISYDIDVAELSQTNAIQQYVIADHQRDIALLKQQCSQDIYEFHKFKFFNKELWDYMARSIHANYETFMNYANVTAWMAERALEFERSEEINIIRFDYTSTDKQGLLAAENLNRDLQALDQHRLTSGQKQNPMKQVVSLAVEYPDQFVEFSETGVMRFRTSLKQFEQKYPGIYQARIKNIEVSVIGLVGSDGVHSSIESLGSSRVRTEEELSWSTKIITHPAEKFLLSLYSKRGDEIYFQPSTVNRELNAFEGIGVDSNWIFSVPKDANNFDYRTVVDIQFIIYFTALHSDDLEQEIRSQYTKKLGGMRAFSLKYDFPDAYYHLQNGYGSLSNRDIRLIEFKTSQKDFREHENNRRIRKIHIFSKSSSGEAKPVAVALTSMNQSVVQRMVSVPRNIGSLTYIESNVWNGLPVDDDWRFKMLPENNELWLDRDELDLIVNDDGNYFLRGVGSENANELILLQDRQIASCRLTFKARFLDDNVVLKVVFKKTQGNIQKQEAILNRSAILIDEQLEDNPALSHINADDHDWYEFAINRIVDESSGRYRLQISVDSLIMYDKTYDNGGFVVDEIAFTVSPIDIIAGAGFVDIDDLQIVDIDQTGARISSAKTENFIKGQGRWSQNDLPVGWFIKEVNSGLSLDRSEVYNTVHPRLNLSDLEDIVFLIEYTYNPEKVLVYEDFSENDFEYYKRKGWTIEGDWVFESEKQIIKNNGQARMIYNSDAHTEKWKNYRLIVDAMLNTGSLELGYHASEVGSIKAEFYANHVIVTIQKELASGPYFNQYTIYYTNASLSDEFNKLEMSLISGKLIMKIGGVVIYSDILNTYPEYGSVYFGASSQSEMSIKEILVEKI